LVEACQLTWPATIALLRPIFEPDRVPTCAEFEAVARWAPLIIMPAYRLATRSLGVAESMRDDALRALPSATDPNPEPLTHYYSVLFCSAHLLLLACAAGHRPWMAEMAKTFLWVNWTPTISLARERTLWLSAAAVRSAAAFGATVTDPYLDKLRRSDHPMSVSDALMGLVAIA
jgi:hypothetical protein